jgi:hypothetical protein
VTVPTTVCEACGASNPIDATFCQNCHAFIGWDRTAMLSAYADRPSPPAPADSTAGPPSDSVSDEASVETRAIPKVPPTADMATDRTAGEIIDSAQVLAVRAEQDRVTVPVSGASAEVALVITNRSDIVDGYEVDVGGAPGWLRVESSTTSLLPGTEGRLVVRFRIESERLVAAGEGTVRLRVRSLTQPPAHEIIPLVVVVPVVDVPVRVRTEPGVVRISDTDVARFVLVVDNSQANRPVRVRLSGTDPELAVSFHFDPDVVVVGPGEASRARVVTTSPRPQPGAELTRSLTVSAAEGNRRAETTVTVVQTTSRWSSWSPPPRWYGCVIPKRRRSAFASTTGPAAAGRGSGWRPAIQSRPCTPAGQRPRSRCRRAGTSTSICSCRVRCPIRDPR